MHLGGLSWRQPGKRRWAEVGPCSRAIAAIIFHGVSLPEQINGLISKKCLWCQRRFGQAVF